jgi:2,3-bisphosphoglycerate-independent phosphoglycerate mutase
MKTIFIILDGLGDRPVKEFGGKTPLEAANTPNMDFLVERGICGMMAPMGLGFTLESGPAHFEIFGYHPFENFYPGRGPIEALGAGFKLKQGDIAFRANFATLKGGKIIDRRAGRIKNVKIFEKKLSFKIKNVEFILKAGTEHRAGLILRGKGLSLKTSNNHSHKTGIKPKKIIALDKTEQANFTAEILNQYLEQAHKILQNHSENEKREKKGLLSANYLIFRGGGEYKKVISFDKKYGLKSCCIAGTGLYKGFGKFLGMKIIKVKGATGGKVTDIKAKFLAAKKNLKNYNFIFVHVKATDLFGHDGDAEGKKQCLEKIDKELKILMKEKCLLSITGDHSTPCSVYDHSGDPVPILFSGKSVRTDTNAKFGERVCAKGGLGRMQGWQIMPEILNLSGKQKIIE